ncbi:MAG: hypothetical protein V4674_02845 [Patescibacteria group bacterium]
MFTVTRSENNPILSPDREHPWEAAASFNWSPVKHGKELLVAYRALSERELLEEPKIHRSIIARAKVEKSGKVVDRAPLIVPMEPWEKFGCEDPRVTKLGDSFYIFYTAIGSYPFSADGIKVAVAKSSDMKTIDERHLVTPFNAKAMALFPEKIRGKYAALVTLDTDHPPSNIAYVECDKIEDLWSPAFWKTWNREANIINFHRLPDDHIELGGAPIETPEGWLILYSHINHYPTEDRRTFGIEAVLLDRRNPRMIIGRTKGAFLVPETYYETTGMVPNVVFPSGGMVEGAYLDIYYGAADTHGATARIRLTDLLRSMLPTAPKLLARFPGNPILAPRPGVAWEAHGVFNAAALRLDDTTHLFYRAMGDDDTSTIGHATTRDGYVIDERSPKPVYVPRADFETKHHPGNSGCEDPRLVELDGKIVMAYTAYDGEVPRVAVTSISTDDFKNERWDAWAMPVVITPPDVPDKDACIIPEKTEHGYVFLHRIDTSICADILPTSDFTKEKVRRCIELFSPRLGMWDGSKVGISGPPIKTKKGWLLFYHGVSETRTYRMGAVLLDLKDPTVLLARTAVPLLEPLEDYELKGVVPKVVFPCGNVLEDDMIYIYYGCTDFTTAVATASLKEILAILT